MGIFQYSFYTVEHVTAMVNSAPIEFIYQHGDYGYGNDRDPMFYELSWDLFFDQMILAMTKVPYMAAPGNHEEFFDFTAYRNRFQMPTPIPDLYNGLLDIIIIQYLSLLMIIYRK